MDTPLHPRCQLGGSKRELEARARAGTNLDVVDRNGHTPLPRAATRINSVGKRGHTPFLTAIGPGSVSIARLLSGLGGRADLHTQKIKGFLILMERGLISVSTAETRIKAGIDIEVADLCNGDSPSNLARALINVIRASDSSDVIKALRRVGARIVEEVGVEGGAVPHESQHVSSDLCDKHAIVELLRTGVTTSTTSGGETLSIPTPSFQRPCPNQPPVSESHSSPHSFYVPLRHAIAALFHPGGAKIVTDLFDANVKVAQSWGDLDILGDHFSNTWWDSHLRKSADELRRVR
ncbi:hypothetical protein BOTBODRAFT_520529 [Botryobasidium botryosum FD-172 SS1]|uniref:Uncharacterized protein n=1 Tax=Botryobasidium botryosum (strain FD-172 SS1) TaxID=930990 RepID=A0A067M2A8_BOTB1|nr:hypothetical protein BOTBODRAFT_520529 [Botryobasidium botryosum FD-172 SS1]